MKNGKRKLAIFITFSLLLGMLFPSSTMATQVNIQKLIEEESQYLVALQLDNGCYPMTSYQEAVDGKVQVSPYFAEFTALALLESGQTYLNSVTEYLDWHFEHLNTKEEDVNGVAGTIYDYWENVDTWSNHVKKETVFTQDGVKFYDSTDSYGALFLEVLSKYQQVSDNRKYLQSHKDQIDLQIDVLQATMKNGLSIATPSYDTQYLMDNCEVFGGLKAGIVLYQKIFPEDTIHIKAMKEMKSQIGKRIGKLYHMEKGGYYDSMLEQQETGMFQPPVFHWKQFYMDATSQLYLITNGVLAPDSNRGKKLYQTFNQYWGNGKKGHNWPTLQIPDEYYWGEIVYCAALEGDKKRVNQYFKAYEKKVHATNHQYPLYNADAAKVIRAAVMMEKNHH